MLERRHFTDRESWLNARMDGIGGSEAAAVIGVSPWTSSLQLWRSKLGMETPKDLSGNPAVAQGVKWEPILRDLFSATHTNLQVSHFPYDILFMSERPFVFATLDGEITDVETGRKGILEIKTATPSGKAGWEKWSGGNMPQHYYVQVLHQLLATGWCFVILYACLYSQDGSYTIKTYEIERSDVKDDLEWLLEQETNFWQRNVLGGKMPAMPLTL